MPGDRERVAEFYSQSGAKIAVVLATRFRIPPEIAQDAVHEIFVGLLAQPKTLARLVKLPPPERFLYLLKAARRRAVRELEHRRHTEKSLEELLAIPESGEQPDAGLAQSDLLDRVRRAIGKMNSPYRRVMEMLILEQKGASEISRALDRPLNTIYQQVHRGAALLRKRLQGV